MKKKSRGTVINYMLSVKDKIIGLLVRVIKKA